MTDMTAARVIEQQITRRLLARQEGPEPIAGAMPAPPAEGRWADRLIATLAVTASLLVVGSFLEELVWVLLAAATVFALGATDSDQ